MIQIQAVNNAVYHFSVTITSKQSFYQCSLYFIFLHNHILLMNSNRQPLYKPIYHFQRPQSPKNTVGHVQSAKNISLTMSIGAKQSPTNFINLPRAKPEQNQQPFSDPNLPYPNDKYQKLEVEIKNISKENFYLKQQNQSLKKQLVRMKRENISENVRSTEKYQNINSDVLNDLRGTIKKESGQIKELKLKLDMVSKQSKNYEELIEKMDQRIKKLMHDQHKKTIEIDELRAELSRIDQLKEKTNLIMRQFSELESKFNTDQLDWMKWKQSWLNEKQYYIKRIHELQVATQNYFP